MTIKLTRMQMLSVILSSIALMYLIPAASGQERPANSPDRFREPVFRVARPPVSVAKKTPQGHPLDPAIAVARQCLVNIQDNVKDYTCTLVKRERIDGKLGNYEYMFTKIRNQRVENGRVVSPLSAYMYFVKPSAVKGREVIYVAGRNNGKMCAHEGGTKGRLIPSVWLSPSGAAHQQAAKRPFQFPNDVIVDSARFPSTLRGAS